MTTRTIAIDFDLEHGRFCLHEIRADGTSGPLIYVHKHIEDATAHAMMLLSHTGDLRFSAEVEESTQ